MDNPNRGDLLYQLVQSSATLAEGHRDILRRIGHLEKQQNQILEQMHRWKGALPVALAIGGAAGWLIGNWHAVVAFFRGSH